MSSVRLQSDQFLDRLVGLSFRTNLQVSAQENQGDDQGSCIIEGRITDDKRKEGCNHTQQVGCGRADGDQCIHVGASMAQRVDGPTMELPAYSCPYRRGECQQELVFSWEAIQEEHAQD